MVGGFLLIPLGTVFLLSLHQFHMATGLSKTLGLSAYSDIVTDWYFAGIFLRTLRIALLVTAASILLGVPEACIIRRVAPRWRSVCLLIGLGPLFISIISRTLGWALLIGSNGLLNQGLIALGLRHEPLDLLYTETGVVIALTHVLVPYILLGTWASLLRIDPSTEMAAASLGASSFTILRRIVLPQVMPGILSGAIIVFCLAASAFATPAIIGGRRLKVVATLVYDEFLNTLNWPLGAAVAIVLLVFVTVAVYAATAFVERKFSQVLE
ncbi:MAG TPA: ABC transporter permease [Rhizomicrobium sp.]|nr:ABC transporter permease [Rhizomicrobium sp.]